MLLFEVDYCLKMQGVQPVRLTQPGDGGGGGGCRVPPGPHGSTMLGEVFHCWPGEPDARVWLTLCPSYSHPQTPSCNGFLLTSVYTTSVSTSVSFKDIHATISSQLLLTVTVNKPLLNETLSNNDRAQLGDCPPGIRFVQKTKKLQKPSVFYSTACRYSAGVSWT